MLAAAGGSTTQLQISPVGLGHAIPATNGRGSCTRAMGVVGLLGGHRSAQHRPGPGLDRNAQEHGGGQRRQLLQDHFGQRWRQHQDHAGRIFSRIQSVNSVFASVSLPVSVNTEGTYLNQVYIGMFRPDAEGAPALGRQPEAVQTGQDRPTAAHRRCLRIPRHHQSVDRLRRSLRAQLLDTVDHGYLLGDSIRAATAPRYLRSARHRRSL